MRGLFLILTVVSLILIIFGAIFAILYAFENEKKKEESPGTYWGLVLGLGAGTALIGIIMFIVVIYLSRRQILKAEISIERLEAQLASLKGGTTRGGILKGYDYLTLDNGEIIRVYNQSTRDSEIAAKNEEAKRKVMANRKDSVKTRTDFTKPSDSVSMSKLQTYSTDTYELPSFGDRYNTKSNIPSFPDTIRSGSRSATL